jgi:O-antigen ligase
MNNVWVGLAVLVVGVAFSTDRFRSMLELGQFCMMSLAWWSLAPACEKHPRITETAAWVMALVPIPTVVTLFLETLARGGLSAAQFLNIRLLDDYLLAQALVLLWLHQRSASSFLRWLALGVGAFYLATLFKDGARADLLAVTLALLLWAEFKTQHPWLGITTALLAVAGIGLLTHAMLPETPLPLGRETSSGRLELLELGWRYWRERPFFGIGGQAWGLYQGAPGLLEGIVRTDVLHPHNFALQIFAEWGLSGGTVLCFLLWRAARALITTRRDHPWALAACVALAFNAMFSGAMVYPHTQLAYIWVASLAAAERAPELASVPIQATTNRRLWQLGLVVLVIAYGLLIGATVVDCAPSSLSSTASGRVFPRFWDDGRNMCFPDKAP